MTKELAYGIFSRTFAALAGAALLAAQGYVWVTSADYRANAILLGLGLLAAVIGALLAVALAFIAQPATSRIEKSIRAFLEKLVAGIGVVAFSEVADVIAFGKLVPVALTAAVLAFAVTWSTYVAPTPATVTAASSS